jgi:hypothetical protein
VAAHSPQLQALVDPRITLGHESRAFVGPFQIMVKQVAISLVVQNVLEKKAGNPSAIVATGTSTFEINPIEASEGNGRMAEYTFLNYPIEEDTNHGHQIQAAYRTDGRDRGILQSMGK